MSRQSQEKGKTIMITLFIHHSAHVEGQASTSSDSSLGWLQTFEKGWAYEENIF